MTNAMNEFKNHDRGVQALPGRPIFVHSTLDELGLSPSVFRVYAHLARRDGIEGAWPAVGTIGEVCRLHPQTVRKAIRELLERGMLVAEIRPGFTTVYRLTLPTFWREHPSLSDIRRLMSSTTWTPVHPRTSSARFHSSSSTKLGARVWLRTRR